MKPVIGVTAPVLDQAERGNEVIPRILLNIRYVRAVRDAGGLPIILPASIRFAANPEEMLDRLDGILFSGGSHQSEHRFLKEKAATLRDTDPERYDYEVTLAQGAYNRRLPIMGICRGHQTLVEALNGRVRSNMELQPDSTVGHHQSLSRAESTHWVETVDDTILGKILGPRAMVNSLHRQAVDKLPEGLRAAAHAADGLIEAVVGEKPFVLGVQFHPEWLYDRRPEFLDFFKIFINQAQK